MSLDKAKIYADLSGIKTEINNDDCPSPSYIQECTFDRNQAERKVEKHYLAVKQELSQIRRLFKIEKFNFDARKRQALSNNEKIKKLPTGKERESACEELFEEDLRKILNLENDFNDLKDLMDAIVMVQGNLKNFAADIRVQLKVMENQVNRLNIGTREDPDVAELHRSLAEIDELEKEMTADDVDSSSESVQEEPVDELITAEVTGEDTSSVADQGTSEQLVEDDTLSSFLVDDSSVEEDSDQTEEDSASEEFTLVEDADAVSVPKDTGAPAKGSSKEKVKAPVTEFDLSDIGIDIDMGVSEPMSTHNTETTKQKITTTTEPPTAPKITPAEKKKEKSVSEKRKEAPSEPADIAPVKTSESAKGGITDIDLDDILTMLDN
jgi:hypothetical protein